MLRLWRETRPGRGHARDPLGLSSRLGSDFLQITEALGTDEGQQMKSQMTSVRSRILRGSSGHTKGGILNETCPIVHLAF